MQEAAIFCASGVGDGILMMIAYKHLVTAGYKTRIYHDKYHLLAPIFPKALMNTIPQKANLEEILNHHSLILIQNDNSSIAWAWAELRKQKNTSKIVFFHASKSSFASNNDFEFNTKVPFATNIAHACSRLLKTPFSKDNGLLSPSKDVFRKFSNRVLIHPTSNDIKRNWTPAQFLELANILQNDRFNVHFCISQNEYGQWKEYKDINIKTFDSLKSLLGFIHQSGFLIGNDSGLGHLASNLGIPTLTISGSYKRVRLWRPDWAINKVVVPYFPIPNFKGINFRLRENMWQNIVSTKKVHKHFKSLIYESCSTLF